MCNSNKPFRSSEAQFLLKNEGVELDDLQSQYTAWKLSEVGWVEDIHDILFIHLVFESRTQTVLNMYDYYSK